MNKRIDQKVSSETEQYLVPYIRRVEFFKEKKMKDHSLIEIANFLKYEFFQKDQIVSETGKTFFVYILHYRGV